MHSYGGHCDGDAMRCRYEFAGELRDDGREHWSCPRLNCNHRHTHIWIPAGNSINPGPCNGIPEWWEFGCWIEAVLRVFGINKERWAWLWQRPTCDACEKREQSLNTLGAHLHTAVSRVRQSVSRVGQKLLAVYRNLRWGRDS